jgi:hypothetical protein
MNPLTMWLSNIKHSLMVGVLFLVVILGIDDHNSHEVIERYKIEAATQAIKVKQVNDKNEKDATDATELLQSTTKNITSYYVAHPASVQYDVCSSGVPKTISNTKGINETGTSTIPTTYYSSEYNPEEVELMSNQLDQLQKLLVKDGVEIK